MIELKGVTLLKILLRIFALSLVCVSLFSYSPMHAETYDDFKITTHNVYFMPQSLYPNWGQMQRADLISRADYIQGNDVIILNELFDSEASSKLLANLQQHYPYQTPVIGQSQEGWDRTSGAYSSVSPTNGGVGIITRFPIIQQEQHIFKNGRGADRFSNKGFAYVKINHNGRPVHVIGTHLQADGSTLSQDKYASVRESQMREIQTFIQNKNIPEDEMVLIGGDLNVIKDTPEYQKMLETLNVNPPTQYSGHTSTWDTATNSIAQYNYPKLEPQYLDYILVERDHANPPSWRNTALKTHSPEWQVKSWGKTYQYQDYSDHYPVQASTS